jgi:hypothetical protein
MSNVTELHPMKLTEEGEIDWTHEPVPDMERAVRNKILEGWLAGNPTTAQMRFTLAMLQMPGPLDEASEMASDSLRAEAIYNDRTKEETLAENAAKLEAVLREVRSGAPESIVQNAAKRISPRDLIDPKLKEGPAACERMSYNQAVSGYKKTLAVVGNMPATNPFFLALLPALWAMHDRARATAPSENRFDRDMGNETTSLLGSFKNA